MWARAADDAWAVGAGFSQGSYGPGVIHWDGSRWSSVMTDAFPRAVPYGVWGSGPDDVWAVGDRGTIVHWDGGRWSSIPSGTTQRLVSVWGSGPSDIWAVGEFGTIVHWKGSGWAVVPPGAIKSTK